MLAATMAGEEPVFRVHPENVVAVRLFQALRTQWRFSSLSTMERAHVVRTGLDYAVLEPVARLKRLELDADDFDRIRLMESEALAAFAEECARR